MEMASEVKWWLHRHRKRVSLYATNKGDGENQKERCGKARGQARRWAIPDTGRGHLPKEVLCATVRPFFEGFLDMRLGHGAL